MTGRKARIFRARHKIKDDGLSPSSIELYDLMYIETCPTAAAIWDKDWMFCPVCLAPINDDGTVNHLPRKVISQ